ncbi:MAG: GTP-binding protein [Candidatus Omnitrophica bacterium]|nr:GTP-binding protein [Candidatus Omnitrophota bacterium]
MTGKFDQLKIAICGHIDHGKSTLIGRLLLDTKSLPKDKLKELHIIGKTFGEATQLAHLSDHLKEERDRNITIETTQVFFKTHKRPYCLIDTPGHLEFIRNMLTGASQAEAALLLIDINEGIAQQTYHHAYLLKLLALPNIILLVNKMDLVNYSRTAFERTKNDLLGLFSRLKIKSSNIIPISALQGDNISCSSKKMPWYHGAHVLSVLDAISNADNTLSKKDLCLPVQDIYSINDKNIVVGRIAAGKIHQGQEITVLPEGQTTTVKTIEIFDNKITSASEGKNIGLTLTTQTSIHRGNILCASKLAPERTISFQGNIFWLSSKELILGQSVTVHCSTQEFCCTVTNIIEIIDPTNLTIIKKNAQSLKQNQAAIIEFTLTTPAVLEKHSHIPELGRYTIENNHELCAAGIVLSTT